MLLAATEETLRGTNHHRGNGSERSDWPGRGNALARARGDLTATRNFVVSRSGAVKGAQVVPSLEEALARAEGTGRTVFIAGGTSIYPQALERDWVDARYLSTLQGDYTGDAFFPTWDEARWELVWREPQTHFEFRAPNKSQI
ncbi:dihydrofolate reductase [Stigmatella hybrida]|uniref:dihydrofolate reductase n=1 Tax=Stigmatella hybrida TaxID=394097 RepID=UPI0037DA6E6F